MSNIVPKGILNLMISIFWPIFVLKLLWQIFVVFVENLFRFGINTVIFHAQVKQQQKSNGKILIIEKI